MRKTYSANFKTKVALAAIKSEKNNAELVDELYKNKLVQLKVENDWLKKLTLSPSEKRDLIDWQNSTLSVNKQCELLSLSKGSLYYKPITMSEYNLYLMDLIDRQYTETPFYGSRRITAQLKRTGYQVNRKRIQRLLWV